MTPTLRAPFPYFGGKSKVAHLVWDYFGDTRNYVEPFAGSLAVLLGRPSEPKIETVNDLDCWIANFWRAVHHDPEQVAAWADWPVNETDLHARHLWLVNQIEFRERMKTDPDFYDAKIAGWWVWGISQWIGSGWCAAGDPGPKRPFLTNHGGGMGRGVLSAEVPNHIPDLSGDSGAAGRGIHASGLSQQIPFLYRPGMGTHQLAARAETGGLYEWFYTLADRLRRVRVCCGDWKRILGPAPTTCIGTTAVFLDPPYAVEDRSNVYGEESREVAHDVRKWALANGDNQDLRIALCGYAGEHSMPASWTEIAWKANGGFGNQAAGNTQGRANANRERIWFSPNCEHPQGQLFSQ